MSCKSSSPKSIYSGTRSVLSVVSESREITESFLALLLSLFHRDQEIVESI
jgi:hypothetical protein